MSHRNNQKCHAQSIFLPIQTRILITLLNGWWDINIKIYFDLNLIKFELGGI